MGRHWLLIVAASIVVFACLSAGTAVAKCDSCDRCDRATCSDCDHCKAKSDCGCKQDDRCGKCEKPCRTLHEVVGDDPGRRISPECCPPGCFELLCCERGEFELLCPKPCKDECDSCKPKCKQDTCTTCKSKCKKDTCTTCKSKCKKDTCTTCKPKCDSCGKCGEDRHRGSDHPH